MLHRLSGQTKGYFTFPPTCLSTALTSSYVSFPSPFASIDSIIAPRSFIEIWRCASFNSPEHKIDLQKNSSNGYLVECVFWINYTSNYQNSMLPFETNPSLFLSIMLNTSSEIIGAVIKSYNARFINISICEPVFEIKQNYKQAVHSKYITLIDTRYSLSISRSATSFLISSLEVSTLFCTFIIEVQMCRVSL